MQAQNDGWNYERSVRQIETILRQIESGDLDLASVFEQFEQATADLAACEAFLQERRALADLQIERLQDLGVNLGADLGVNLGVGNPQPPLASEDADDEDVPF